MEALQTILKLLKSRDAEVACAAALVAGRLRPVRDDVVHALGRALEKADRASASYFVDALAATRSPLAVPYLVPLLEWSGSIVEMATRVLRKFGTPTLTAIERAHADRDDWINGAYVKVVAGIHREESVRMLLARLPDSCWEHARATSILMRENFTRYPPRARKTAKAFLGEYMARPMSDRTPHATVTCLRLARELGFTLNVPDVFRASQPRMPASMRRHALHLLEVSKPDADKVEELRPRLLEYLSESDEESVVLPTLGVLSAWNDPPMSVEMLVRMAHNPRSAVSESAVRTLGRTWPDAVDELTTFVGSRLPLVRSTAAAMLSASDAGRTRLLELLCDHEQDRVRREIAERLVRTSTAVSKADVTRLRRKFMDDCVATERYDRPLLEYLAGQDRDGFNKTVVRRARGYVENDRANDAISILQPLVRWRHGSEEARYWLAIAHLHRANERSPEDDDFRRGVGLFSSLSRTEGWSLPARVARGSSLDTTVVLAALESLAAHGPTEAADVATMLEAVEVGASRTLRTAKKAVESVLAGL